MGIWVGKATAMAMGQNVKTLTLDQGTARRNMCLFKNYTHWSVELHKGSDSYYWSNPQNLSETRHLICRYLAAIVETIHAL